MKFAMAGSAAFDVTLLDPYEIIDGQSPPFLRIHPEEGHPVNIKLPGYKVGKSGKINSDSSLDERLRGITRRESIGGGGPNSARTGRKLEPEAEIILMDVSCSSDLVERTLDDAHIDYYFFGKRPIPTNIWIPQYDKEGRQHNLGIAGPTLERYTPQQDDLVIAKNYLEGSDALLLNSMKDHEFALAFMNIMKEAKRPVYMVVTPSLKKDFAFVEENFLPYSVGIWNYKELNLMLGKKTTDENRMKQYARETMRRLEKNKNFVGRMYVTLDEGGVYALDRRGLYHIHLLKEYGEKVDNFLRAGNGTTRGVGDGFAAHIMLNETKTNKGLPAYEYARHASRFSILEGIGFEGGLPDEALVVRKL